MLEPDARRWAVPAVALLFLVIAALLAYIVYERGLFGRLDRLYVEAPDAAGMTEGMQVTTRGVVIGSVRSIALPAAQPGDQGARIELSIGRDYMAQIPKGTRARLVQDNAIGKPTIDLVSPRGGTQSVDSGDVLAFERGKDGGQIVQEIQAALMPVIADARKLTESLTDPDGSFQQTLKAGQEEYMTTFSAMTTCHLILRTRQLLPRGAYLPSRMSVCG